MELLRCRESFENMDYDNMEINFKVYNDSIKTISVTLKNAKESASKFLNQLKENKMQLAKIVGNCQPEVEVIREITEAIKFMDHFMTCEVPALISSSIKTVAVDSKKSLFEVLCQLFVAISAGYQKIQCKVHSTRVLFVNQIFSGFNVQEEETAVQEFAKTTPNYCTLIVTESSDIESASDQLVTSWSHLYAPWTIRSVYVQESVSVKFIQLVHRKLKPINEVFLNDDHFKVSIIKSVEKLEKMGLKIIQNVKDTNAVKATLVQNTTREFIEDTEYAVSIINLNVFRTIKELLTLLNADLKDSASIWAENISVAFELADGLKCSNVWINSNEILNPKFSYKFGENIFGEILGDSKSKVLFENKVHFQTIGLENGKFKTIITPFGATFGN